MSGYNFSDRVRKVLQIAREEAARLHQPEVDTEHLLLALIKEGEGVAVAILLNLGVELEELRESVSKNVGPIPVSGPDLPYTSRAKKVLELSMSEARLLNHHYVGTEHLLLGLMREGRGLAAQALAGCGLGLEGVRAEAVRLLNSDKSIAHAPAMGGPSWGIAISVSHLLIIAGALSAVSGAVAFAYAPIPGKILGSIGVAAGLAIVLISLLQRSLLRSTGQKRAD